MGGGASVYWLTRFTFIFLSCSLYLSIPPSSLCHTCCLVQVPPYSLSLIYKAVSFTSAWGLYGVFSSLHLFLTVLVCLVIALCFLGEPQTDSDQPDKSQSKSLDSDPTEGINKYWLSINIKTHFLVRECGAAIVLQSPKYTWTTWVQNPPLTHSSTCIPTCTFNIVWIKRKYITRNE